MKQIITLLFIGFTITALPQSPINSYYSVPGSIFDIIDPATVLNQTAGPNQTWDFADLVKVGESIDSYSIPTSAESTSYPGTTNVLLVTSTVNSEVSNNRFYTKNSGNQITFTAFNGPDFELNYISDNALIGTFPLSYGYTNNDPVSGTFVYGTNSGTFQGTFNSSVDAYGTLQVTNAGARDFIGNVTRLKTVQNLNLSSGILTNVGTATLTNYNYYSSSNGYLIFRYALLNINVPLLAINQTSTSIEKFQTVLLSRDENEFSKSIVTYPNPTSSEFKISNPLQLTIESIRLFDMYGKEVLKTKEDQNITISNLNSGIYLVVLSTEKGTISKRIVKK